MTGTPVVPCSRQSRTLDQHRWSPGCQGCMAWGRQPRYTDPPILSREQMAWFFILFAEVFELDTGADRDRANYNWSEGVYRHCRVINSSSVGLWHRSSSRDEQVWACWRARGSSDRVDPYQCSPLRRAWGSSKYTRDPRCQIQTSYASWQRGIGKLPNGPAIRRSGRHDCAPLNNSQPTPIEPSPKFTLALDAGYAETLNDPGIGFQMAGNRSRIRLGHELRCGTRDGHRLPTLPGRRDRDAQIDTEHRQQGSGTLRRALRAMRRQIRRDRTPGIPQQKQKISRSLTTRREKDSGGDPRAAIRETPARLSIVTICRIASGSVKLIRPRAPRVSNAPSSVSSRNRSSFGVESAPLNSRR
jgi:hypothetical protein